jgi:hypothetical protein
MMFAQHSHRLLICDRVLGMLLTAIRIAPATIHKLLHSILRASRCLEIVIFEETQVPTVWLTIWVKN